MPPANLKAMNKAALLNIGLGICCMVANGQISTNTTTPVSVTTNYITAHRSFRRVDGRLYNIEKSHLWSDIKGTCTKVLTNGIVVRTFVEKQREIPSSSDRRKSTDVLLGSGARVPSSESWEEEGPDIFLVNYDGPRPTTGKKIRTKAMEISVYPLNGKVIEMWDCGTPNVVPVIVTNAPALQPKTRKGTNAPAKETN
jgi:hypothetical protein